MRVVSVTLDVSQLRSWSKARAFCRGSQAQGTRCGASRGPGGGRRRVIPGRARGVPGKGHTRLQIGWQGAQGAAHVKHPFHAPDAGGVPVQGLVEGSRALPRVASTGHTVRREPQAGRREAACDTGACSRRAGERARDCRLVAGRGEQRTKNMEVMLLTLEVSRLSGWLKAAAE